MNMSQTGKAAAPKLPNHNSDTLGNTLEGLLGWAAKIEALLAEIAPGVFGKYAVLAEEGTALAETAVETFSPPPPSPALMPAPAAAAASEQPGPANTVSGTGLKLLH
jgi:hypothetical protein